MRPEDVASLTWKTFHDKVRLNNPFPAKPAVTPPFIKGLLDPAMQSDNPMMITQARSTVAWQWLCYRGRHPDMEWAATGSWWSRLAVRHQVPACVFAATDT